MGVESSLSELRSLVDAVCADTVSQEDLHALSTLLTKAKGPEYYLEYCRMHVELYFCCGEQRLNEVVLEDIRSGDRAVFSPHFPQPTPSTARSAISPRAGRWRIWWQR